MPEECWFMHLWLIEARLKWECESAREQIWRWKSRISSRGIEWKDFPRVRAKLPFLSMREREMQAASVGLSNGFGPSHALNLNLEAKISRHQVFKIWGFFTNWQICSNGVICSLYSSDVCYIFLKISYQFGCSFGDLQITIVTMYIHCILYLQIK